MNTTWVLAKPGSNTTVSVTLQWKGFPTHSLTIQPSVCNPTSSKAFEEKKVLESKRATKASIPEWRKAPNRDLLFGMQSAPRPDISFVNITSDIMLLTITTFEPDDEQAFMQTLTNGILFATKYNISKLLIDLSGNGGGDICLGFNVISQLLNEIHPVGSYDMVFLCWSWFVRDRKSDIPL